MLKRFAKRINLNFRRSSADRASIQSYSNYHQRIKKTILNVLPFKKIKK